MCRSGWWPSVLGQLGAAIEEVDAGHEVLHLPILADPLAVVRETPAVELFELRLGFVGRIRIDAALARLAFLFDQFGRRLNGHDCGSCHWLGNEERVVKQLLTVRRVRQSPEIVGYQIAGDLRVAGNAATCSHLPHTCITAAIRKPTKIMTQAATITRSCGTERCGQRRERANGDEHAHGHALEIAQEPRRRRTWRRPQ